MNQAFFKIFLNFFLIFFFFSFEGRAKEKKESFPILPPFSFEEEKKKPTPKKEDKRIVKSEEKGSRLGFKFSELFHSTIDQFKKKGTKPNKGQNRKALESQSRLSSKDKKFFRNSLENSKSKEDLSLFDEKEEESPIKKKSILRMLLSLVFIGGIGALFIFIAHWWKRNYQFTTRNKKIQILSQYYLGSKKRLMIIRVAGEHLLLGVTDHNISLIKSLSLLEEDSSLESEENFVKELAGQFQTKSESEKSPLKRSYALKKDFIEEKGYKNNPEKLSLKKSNDLKESHHSLEKVRSLIENKLRNKKKIG